MNEEDLKREARDWLRQLPELTGDTLTGIAREIGVAASTLTKAANDPKHKHVLSWSTISKIVAHYHVPPPRGFEENGGEPRTPPEVTRIFVSFDNDGANGEQDLLRLLAKHYPKANPWRINSNVLELAGYFPGDIVFVDSEATPQPPQNKHRDVVLASVYDRARARSEPALRLYKPPYLKPHSRDEAYEQVHEDAATIMGVVLACIRLPRKG